MCKHNSGQGKGSDRGSTLLYCLAHVPYARYLTKLC